VPFPNEGVTFTEPSPTTLSKTSDLINERVTSNEPNPLSYHRGTTFPWVRNVLDDIGSRREDGINKFETWEEMASRITKHLEGFKAKRALDRELEKRLHPEVKDEDLWYEDLSEWQVPSIKFVEVKKSPN